MALKCIRFKLIDKKTGEWSGLYTATDFDIYKNRKTKKKYVRGEHRIYTENETAPPAIEDTDSLDDWKRYYTGTLSSGDDLHLFKAAASTILSKGKYDK